MANRNTDTASKSEAKDFRDVGGRGVKFSHDGKFLLLAIPMTEDARKKAAMSTSGKNRLLATTGGFQTIPGTDIRVAVNATIPLAE